MLRIFLFSIPYLFQLLCIIHIIKNHKESFWIWIVIILPYIGGIAYLVVEILPLLFTRKNISRFQDHISNIVVPGNKLKQLEEKANYSPTHENLVQYANALIDSGDYKKGLDLLIKQTKGVFENNSYLIHRIAYGYYMLNEYEIALNTINKLRDKKENIFLKRNDISIYLLINEAIKEPDQIINEYQDYIKRTQDIDIIIQYLIYLEKRKNKSKIDFIKQELKIEENSLKRNNIAYDRSKYRKAYSIGNDLK